MKFYVLFKLVSSVTFFFLWFDTTLDKIMGNFLKDEGFKITGVGDFFQLIFSFMGFLFFFTRLVFFILRGWQGYKDRNLDHRIKLLSEEDLRLDLEKKKQENQIEANRIERERLDNLKLKNELQEIEK